MNEKINQWTVTVEEDPVTGELLLPFPDDVIQEAGWTPGDVLVWTMDENCQYVVLSKKED